MSTNRTTIFRPRRAAPDTAPTVRALARAEANAARLSDAIHDLQFAPRVSPSSTSASPDMVRARFADAFRSLDKTRTELLEAERQAFALLGIEEAGAGAETPPEAA
jgi:hypothetical protein